MSVTLGSITDRDGSSRQSIDIHNFVSIKQEGRWRQYGTFEVKTYIIKTRYETIRMDMFRDKKEE